MRSWLSALPVSFLLTATSTGNLACSSCKVQQQKEATEYTGGLLNKSHTIYESSAADSEMLYFPEGRTYDLVHGLSSTPVSVDLYVSFREKLDSSDKPDSKSRPNNLSPSAGNQAVIEVWNDRIIRVRNDTCAEFYLRVVAISDPDLAPGGGGDVGGAGGAADE
jgi:hypothetical protein